MYADVGVGKCTSYKWTPRTTL